MKSSVVLAAMLCLGLASVPLYAHAQLIEFPPLFPSPDEEPEPVPGNNGTDSTPAAEQSPDNSTSMPEPPAPQPQLSAGNESSNTPAIAPRPILSPSPCLEYDEESHMVHIVCDADIYELFSSLRDDSITQQLGSGQILLNANVTVDEGATFSIHSAGGIDYVKIADSNGITVNGAIHIDEVKITSWDPENNAVIEQDDNGSEQRAFLFLSGSEGSRIYNSELGYMGYNETGYRGVDLMHGSNSFTIANSTFHHMWYAFFSNAAFNVTIDSSEYYDNHLYAIDPHTGTYNMTISNNTLHGNNIGLVCSLDCYDIIFEGNTIYNNSGTGIFFSRNTHDSIARNNIIYDQPIGIGFSESSNNLVYGNDIRSVGRGIFLNDPEIKDDGSTTNNRVYNNTISDSAVGIVALRTTENIASYNIFNNITMSHYRLDASAGLIIENQTFENATIEGQGGENVVTFANSSIIMIDGIAHDASLQHTIALSNQTIMVISVPRDHQ